MREMKKDVLMTIPAWHRLVMIATPLALGILEIFHPIVSANHILPGILPHVNWWIMVHILQLPLFCLIALAVYLSTRGLRHWMATMSRIGIAIFVIFYPAFDSIIGIGTGALVRYAAELPATQRAIVSQALAAFVENPIANTMAHLGALGWEVGVVTAALALSQPVLPRRIVYVIALLAILFGVWTAWIGFAPMLWWIGAISISIMLGLTTRQRVLVSLFTLSALFFGGSHVPPFGPIGMGCFFLAVLQLELLRRKSAITEPVMVKAPG